MIFKNTIIAFTVLVISTYTSTVASEVFIPDVPVTHLNSSVPVNSGDFFSDNSNIIACYVIPSGKTVANASKGQVRYIEVDKVIDDIDTLIFEFNTKEIDQHVEIIMQRNTLEGTFIADYGLSDKGSTKLKLHGVFMLSLRERFGLSTWMLASEDNKDKVLCQTGTKKDILKSSVIKL